MISIRMSSVEHFRDYMFRKLGEEYVDVEISDLQWGDILRDSVNTYSHYSESGVYESYVLIDTDNKRTLNLPAEVMNIHKVISGSKENVITRFREAVAASGGDNHRDDFKYDAMRDGSVSIVPTYDDAIANGQVVAGIGLNDPTPPIIKMPEMTSTNSLYHPLGKDIGYSSNLFYPMLFSGTGSGDLSLSTYAITMGLFDTINSLFKTDIYFSYKPESRRLVLGKTYEMILVEADILEPVENFINDDFFKLIVEEKLLTQWADNLSLKYQSEGLMGNGINLNTERMLEKAATLREKIEAGNEEDEWGGLLAPFRT